MSKLIDTSVDAVGDIVLSRADAEIARIDAAGNITTKGAVNGGYRPVLRLDDPRVGGTPTALGDTPVDSLATFNTAISVAQSLFNGGCDIIVPRGQWFTLGDIVLPDQFRLRGESVVGSRIRAMTGYSGTAMVRNLSNSQEYIWVEDLYIDGRGFAPIGILYDTVFVNSGIRRVVCTTHTINGVKLMKSVISGGAGPIALEDVWASSSGQDCLLVSDAVQVWSRNLTVEHPGAGYACLQVTGNGAAQGILFDGIHLESSTNNGCNGIVIDGALNVRLKNISAGGSKPVTDIVKLTNASGTIANVEVDGIYTSSTAPNGIHDVVNGLTVTGKNHYGKYVMPDSLTRFFTPRAQAQSTRDAGTILLPAFPIITGSGAVTGQFQYRGFRVVIPYDGVLRNFYIAPSVQNGNVEGVILDDTVTTRNRLWTSGSVACPAISVWTSIGDPNLAVVAGQHVDFLLGTDSATAAFYRYLNMPLNALVALPSGILVAPGGAIGEISWQVTRADFTGFPSTFAEASMVAQAAAPMILVKLT